MNSHRATTSPLKTEPVITAASAGALVSAVLTLLVAFGIDLTDAQTAAILGVTGVAFPIVFGLIAAVIARSKVTPTRD